MGWFHSPFSRRDPNGRQGAETRPETIVHTSLQSSPKQYQQPRSSSIAASMPSSPMYYTSSAAAAAATGGGATKQQQEWPALHSSASSDSLSSSVPRSSAPTAHGGFTVMRVPHMDFGSDNMMPDPFGVGMRRHATWSTSTSTLHNGPPTPPLQSSHHVRSPSNDSFYPIQKEAFAGRRASEASLSAHLRPSEVESMLII